MNFRKVNNLTGWAICLIASAVYLLTMERTGSLWDCGEFVASAYKLQVPHPPGAPLYTLIGRFFIILFGDEGTRAALAVNTMSALASGFTILFLFWTITHFARKIVAQNGEEPNGQQMFSIMAAGVVGALAYTFSDSFWYSAVEGEVYALSSFFTAIAFWSILKWEHEVDYDRKHGIALSQADRWVVFIFFLMGLSVGVHLLNLLTLPAIVMLYYFKRYKVTRWGTFLAFVVGCIVTGIVQVVIIQWSIKGAGAFDRFFVNSMSMPFFSGFAIYFILIAALLIVGLRFSEASIKKFGGFALWLVAILLLFCFPIFDSATKVFLFLLGLSGVMVLCYLNRDKILSFLRVAIWSIVFLIIGYSTYFTTLIRSTANPGVDMYNVDNPVSLVGYLSREQYGDWPILYGGDFYYRPQYKTTGDLYVKGKDKYEVAGKVRQTDFGAKPDQSQIDELMRQNPTWDESKIGPHIFPRMWDNGNERGQEDAYRQFGSISEGEQPSFANNIAYFANYQFRVMYFRYFMWNFSGKQNDLQGFGNIRDGNWITGIGFIDKMFYGAKTEDLPATAGVDNKANNKLFLLPFILGVLGFIYHLMVHRRDWLISALLFFTTGFAIVIYLNQAGYQPRERDYAYVGSFYAFAIWIGIGVLQIRDWLRMKTSLSVANYLSFAVCLAAVPILMASQEWDDHDRHKKTLATDMGRNYLESCEKDAILISFGDNDTYPVWYSQEVEHQRPDIRVMNYSLLGTDWYINQLRYKVNNSAPADVIFTTDQIQGSKRDVIPVYPLPGFDQNRYYDLYTVLKDVVGSDDSRYTVQSQEGEPMNVMPVKKLSIPVDANIVRQNGVVKPGDSVVSSLLLDIKKNYLLKNDLAVLALIAANKWQRPIYFTSMQDIDDLGLAPYIRMEGLCYRLVPVKGSDVNPEASYKVMMEKFRYGNAKEKGVFFDEENRRQINSIRSSTAILAMTLADSQRKDSAKKVLHRYDDNVLEENVPYGFTSNRGNMHNRISMSFLYASYRAGDTPLAKKVSTSVRKDLNEQLKYYRLLGDQLTNEQLAGDAMNYLQSKPHNITDKQVPFAQDIYSSYQMLLNIDEWEKQYGPPQPKSLESNAPIINDSAPKKDTNKR
jgi:Protein of unknown function (DUF2723)